MAIGDFNHWHLDTVLGFGLCAFNAFTLWQIHNDAYGISNSLESALTDQFGENYNNKIIDERKLHLNDTSTSLTWLKPFSLKQNNIETIKDIKYGEADKNTLTLYKPKNADLTKPMPVMLQIHGGGWVTSYSDKQALPLRNQLVSGNWLFVAINYRLSPNAKFPDHLVDCKKHCYGFKKHQGLWRKSGFLMVTAGAAGGHLASLLCFN